MSFKPVQTLASVFSHCRRTLGRESWGRVLAATDPKLSPAAFPDRLVPLIATLGLPGYLADLARLEWVLYEKASLDTPPVQSAGALAPNDSLTLLPLEWRNLPMLIDGDDPDAIPVKAPAHVMIWRHPRTGVLHCQEAGDEDLLALKLAVDRLDPREAARLGKVTTAKIHIAIDQAVARGIVVAPPSRIHRHRPPAGLSPALEPFLAADIFTLQWHITQACDLHCRHCYDRSSRGSMPEQQALAVLDDFYAFCRRMHVRGQVSFTGGNPLLYPHLETLYRAAAQLGLGVALLGNPGSVEPIRQLADIAHPAFFQISLEGLEAHNDTIRGDGHFQRSLAFLDGLRELGIYSMVMLTLTRDNLDQVLPLAELLKGRADAFNFNRLAAVGEGADLQMPAREDFRDFLRQYEKAAAANPMMGLKDNLFNLNRDKGAALLGGCTGFGCGAAFNFFALLPDGEVHACRKFPSLIGRIQDASLYDIYRSPLAARYREGSRACRGCDLNLVCRGCLAVAYSLGLDIFSEKDPFCHRPPCN